MSSNINNFEAEQEANDLKIFRRIQNDPKPQPIDLWMLSEVRFLEWRRKHDLPNLLQYLDKRLPCFVEWKAVMSITSELILEIGLLTEFVERKPLAKKDKKKYIYRQTRSDWEKTIISESVLNDSKGIGGYKFKLKGTFLSYFDWLAENKYKTSKFEISRGLSPFGHQNAWLHVGDYNEHSDYMLLQMGHFEIPLAAAGSLFASKQIEFANLSNIKFIGDIPGGGYSGIKCSYCTCHNWSADAKELHRLQLKHCTIDQLRLTRVIVSKWSLYNCIVTGSATTANFDGFKVIGGNFDIDLRDCLLRQVEILEDKAIPNKNLEGYKMLKTLYAEQGDDDLAKMYYVKEMEWKRKDASFPKNIWLWLMRIYWNHGSEPTRIIPWSIALIIVFAFGYLHWASLIMAGGSVASHFNLGDALYFSTTTFTTLGYGDLAPIGVLRALTSIEAFLGIANLGFLVAGLASKKY